MAIRVLAKTTATLSLFLSLSHAQSGQWTVLSNPDPTDNPGISNLLAREECSFSQAGGKFYLLGGRRADPVQEYNPQTNTWKNLKVTKDTLNHFQAVSSAGLIYIICAFKESPGHGYPKEPPATEVSIYDPLSDTWVKGMTIPLARRRGSAGVVESNGKFYVVNGNTLGHEDFSVKFLDEFDPTSNTWTPLLDSPHPRDHFQAATMNGKIYALGGRRSGHAGLFDSLEKVDVYDIEAKSWSTLPTTSDLKSPRSGGIVVPLGAEIVYAGGSNPPVYTKGAYDSVRAFNTTTNSWRPLANMNFARQVTGGFINNSGFYVASGSGGTGGGPQTRSMEAFFMNGNQPVTGDPLVAGKLAPADTNFNMGIILASQSLTKQFQLRHISGNQGVVISSLAVTGDPAFKLKTTVTAPYLVRPGQSSPVEITFTSTGTAPAASFLEVTYAIPPGATLKVPLDANRTPAAVLVRSINPNARSLEETKSGTPLFQSGSKSGHWNALGKKKIIPASIK